MDLRRRGHSDPKDQETGNIEYQDDAEFVGAPQPTTVPKESELSLLSLPEASIVYAVLLGLGFLLVLGAYGAHYRLPQANDANVPLDTFSEGRARSLLSKLVELGPRWSGTKNCDVYAVEILLGELDAIRREEEESAGGQSSFQVEIQSEPGSFYLSFLGTVLTNSYDQIVNVIVRVPANAPLHPESPDSTPALLVNSHFDTGLWATGASDASSGVVVILEMLRNLLASKATRNYDLILLLNGAEESLLCAAHMFTKHKWAEHVKAVINLEAVGAGGQEIIFQVNNEALCTAYCEAAPYPHGAILAQEIFSSGAVPSDTDFRIFRDFLGVPGIDMAFYSNGYVYHTLADDMEAISSGSLQHMGENVLGVVKHLLDEGKSKGILSNIHPVRGDPTNPGAFTTPLDFFDLFGVAVYFSHTVAKYSFQYTSFFAGVAWIIIGTWNRDRGAFRVARAAGFIIFCGASAVVFAVGAALFCVHVLRVPLFFYANRWMAFVTFGPVSMLGTAIGVRYVLARSQKRLSERMAGVSRPGRSRSVAVSAVNGITDFESRILDIQHFYWMGLTALGTILVGATLPFDLGSTGLFSLWTFGVVACHGFPALYEYFFRDDTKEYESESDDGTTGSYQRGRNKSKDPFYSQQGVDWLQFRGLLWSKSARLVFFLVLAVPLLLTLHLWFSILDLVVPTLGRTGALVPATVVMGAFVAIILVITMLPAVPFLLAAGNVSTVIRVLAILSVAGLCAALFSAPFDERHPRRMVIQHVNRLPARSSITQESRTEKTKVDVGDHFIALSSIDKGPEYRSLVPPAYTVAPSIMGKRLREEFHNVYPFTQHLSLPLKIVGVAPPSGDTFASGSLEHVLVVKERDTFDETANVRNVSVAVHFGGFDFLHIMIDVPTPDTRQPEVVGWSLGDALPDAPCGHYFIRHLPGRSNKPFRFYLLVKGKEPLGMQANGAHFTTTTALKEFLDKMPKSITPIAFYVENSEWFV